ncbi:MAG: precorrin-6A/cobalt-precorrin-6A reductase [Alphaproteobacteria bacterium]|nr:precorrin-6A/cobalt-precorrin-6A reductase [Alphaproteobacteria bacterium]
MHTLLILGGTSEARELAQCLADSPQWRVIYSLAGVMAANQPREDALGQQGVTIRRGGFGGAAGLAAFIAQEQIAGVIDATHPFAENMVRNGLMAARHMNCKWAKIWRAPWAIEPSENLQILPNIAASAAKLGSVNLAATAKDGESVQFPPPPLRRIFLALGLKGSTEWAKNWHSMGEIAAAAQPELIIARTFAAAPLPLGLTQPEITWLQSPPASHPYENTAIGAEAAFLQQYQIDLVIARNSGGNLAGKLTAAGNLGCHIWLIERPDLSELGLTAKERQHIFATPAQFYASQWLELT